VAAPIGNNRSPTGIILFYILYSVKREWIQDWRYRLEIQRYISEDSKTIIEQIRNLAAMGLRHRFLISTVDIRAAPPLMYRLCSCMDSFTKALETSRVGEADF
jgi:hypothetical protein